MNVLGLSYGFHDSSAALIVDGKLVASAREENHTKQKHDAFFPQFAIESCLKKAGLKLKDIHKVSYYEKTEKKWTRVLTSTLNGWPFSFKEFSTSMKSWLGRKLWTEAILMEKLNLKNDQFSSFSHHLSHATQAFISSEFQEAAILTIDAVGEKETCTEYFAKWENGKPIFKKLTSHEYPHSLGLFYSAITDFLGFKPMSDECSTMALASFGDDRLIEKMRKTIQVDEKGKIILNQDYFQFDRYYSKPYTKKFIDVFGKPFIGKYNYNSLEKVAPSNEEMRLAQVAYAAQKVLEECLLKLAHKLLVKTKSKNLCLAGGVALNCVANTNLLENSGFDNLYIPNDPGDGGASQGAAFLAFFEKNSLKNKIKKQKHSQGISYHTEDLEEVLRYINPSKLQKHRKLGTRKKSKERWIVRKFEKSEALLFETAKLIQSDRVVGWFQEGVEYGPRALGYRSILFKASNLDVVQNVSTKIKDRAKFRPYALSMTDKAAKKVLDTSDLNQAPLRAMQMAVKVKSEYVAKLRGGLHIDLTTRPQIVLREENSRYYDLLSEYERMEGVGAFINTSFNESGYPIVENPYDALLMFARTDMDALVINNILIKKSENPL